MTIVGHISRTGAPIADVTYRAGLHVEVRVAKSFQSEKIYFELSYSDNDPLRGTWEDGIGRLLQFWELRFQRWTPPRGDAPRRSRQRPQVAFSESGSFPYEGSCTIRIRDCCGVHLGMYVADTVMLRMDCRRDWAIRTALRRGGGPPLFRHGIPPHRHLGEGLGQRSGQKQLRRASLHPQTG